MKKLFLIIFLALISIACDQGINHAQTNTAEPVPSSQVSTSNADAVDEAYKHRARNIQVQGKGVIVKLLADDNQGSRHQRFLVKVQTGQVLLFTHNLDLAPRVSPLVVGDEVEFNGEYVYNPKGGIIHWTHKDPQGQHMAGWIRHNGQTYQ